MHRGSRLLLGTTNAIKTQLLLLVFFLLEVRFFAKSLYLADEGIDYTKGCELLTCKIGEECVNRKFWCKHSPCPSMTYCSRSKKESLKGPETCDAVSCTTGYKCFVRSRGCEWNQSFSRTDCKEYTARCVSEVEPQNEPANCADTACPMGHRCILRESHCYQVPCKLTKSCAPAEDVQVWFENCRQLGCPSEEQCFLRKPPQLCTNPPCNHVPDCLSSDYFEGEEQSMNEYCRGWICPPNQRCSASFELPCRHDHCPVIRTCQASPYHRYNISQERQRPILSHELTLNQFEREAIFEEHKKLRTYLHPTSAANNTTKWQRSGSHATPRPSRYSGTHKNHEHTSQKEHFVTSSPSIRSTSFGELPWLTYFKKKAGAHAVQYWIEKSKINDNYEGFVGWLESVSELLDADTYRLWYRELEAIAEDIPQFKSWISMYNFIPRTSSNYHRQPNANANIDARTHHPNIVKEPRRKHMGSYGKTLAGLYGKRFTPKSSPRVVPAGLSDRIVPLAEYESSSEERRFNPSNYNFNEPRRDYEVDPPGFRPNPLNPPVNNAAVHSILPRPLYDHRMPVQDPTHSPSYGLQYPETSTPYHYHNFKDSWNQWNSYHYGAAPTGPEYARRGQDSYYFNNYTRGPKNINKIYESKYPRQQPSQLFYPQNTQMYDEALLAQLGRKQWPQGQTDVNYKKFKVHDDEDEKKKYAASNSDESLPSNPVSLDVGSLMTQIAGLPRINPKQQSVIQLDSDQDSPRFVLSPSSTTTNSIPKLLIYFPPPLNFFIYYSVKNQNQTSKSKPTKFKSSDQNASGGMIIPWENIRMNINNKTEENSENTLINIEHVTSRSKKQNKLKKHDYIRKIIRELIEFWDDEERIFDTSNEEDDESKSIEITKLKENKKHENNNYNGNSIIDTNSKPTFDKFLEWLTQHKDYKNILDQKLRKKKPVPYPSEKHPSTSTDKNMNYSPKNPPHAEPSEEQNTKKIRILVDIDKNPEIMEKFVTRHSAHSNKSDTHDYQIIVNLKDFFDAKEEDVISRKLVDIASNHLHKNLTNNQKLPKTLWVFPIYDDEENDSLINQLERNTYQQLNTLENDISTDKNDNFAYIKNVFNRNVVENELRRGKKDNSTQNELRNNEKEKTVQVVKHSKRDGDKSKKKSHKRRSEKVKTKQQ